MKLKRLLAAVLAGLALALAGIAIAGCGGSSASGDENPQTYEEVLHGLKQAALAGKHYDAAQRAVDFRVGEKDAIVSFCEFAWEIGVNHEAWKLSLPTEPTYVVSRIRGHALSRDNLASVETALTKLNAVIDPSHVKAGLLHRYKNACYS